MSEIGRNDLNDLKIGRLYICVDAVKKNGDGRSMEDS